MYINTPVVNNFNVKNDNSKNDQVLKEDSNYIQTLWRGDRKYHSRQLIAPWLQKYNQSIFSNGKDVSGVRKVIEKYYWKECDIIFNRRENHLDTRYKYPEFFKKGGYEGLMKEVNGIFSCFSQSKVLEIMDLRDEVFEYFKKSSSACYYWEMKNEKEVDREEYINRVIGSEGHKILGMQRSLIASHLDEAYSRMEEFAVLEYELARRKELQRKKGFVDRTRHWDDEKHPELKPSMFEKAYRLMVWQLSTEFDLSERGLTAWSVTKTKLCAPCINLGWSDPNKMVIVDEKIYKRAIMILASSYSTFKESVPNMTHESFAQLWACKVADTLGAGRELKDIVSDLIKETKIQEKKERQIVSKNTKNKEKHLKTLNFGDEKGKVEIKIYQDY